MNTSIDQLATVSPAVWPGKSLRIEPGNLDLFLPPGLGIGGPLPIMPWDEPAKALGRRDYYGFQQPTGHPLRDAPRASKAGGTVYFGDSPAKADLEALLRLLEIHAADRQFAIFLAHATEPKEQGYLTQLRIVSRFALRFVFDALNDKDFESFPAQPLSLAELVWAFIEDQQREYGDDNRHKLDGVMGGDGDWACERLAFGFMLENAYNQVYRIWSRAWLVTK